jgi:hypothetical protein
MLRRRGQSLTGRPEFDPADISAEKILQAQFVSGTFLA